MTSLEKSKVSNIVLLIDFDNIAISTEQFYKARFDVSAVIDSLRDRGRIIIKRAYADWKKWASYQGELLSNAVDMVHVPYHGGSNKNNADIKMAVDAMETVYRNPIIDTFILISGDSDFQSLVAKLRENGKYVITIGVKEATSNLLIYNSDEFISYESMTGLGGESDVGEAYQLLLDVMESTVDKELLSLSNIKNLLLQKNPSFNEKEYGFKQFKNLVLAAEERGLIVTERGKRGQEMFLDIASGARGKLGQPKEAAPHKKPGHRKRKK